MDSLPPRFRQMTGYDTPGYYSTQTTSRAYSPRTPEIQWPTTIYQVLYYVYRALCGANFALCEILSLFLAETGLADAWDALQPFLFLLVIVVILNYCAIWLFFMGAAAALFYLLLFRRMARNNPDPHFF